MQRPPRKSLFIGLRLGVLALCWVWFEPQVFAQGGPPLVGDDPETPGAGHWELDLAGILTHRVGETVWRLPDIDLNYGWGENIQLKLETPYSVAENLGEPTTSGLGSSLFGLKWRFFEHRESGLAVSVYPQWTTHLVRSSVERGVADAGSEWFLPVEVAIKVKGYDLDAEVGRCLAGCSQRGWEAGFIAGRSCLSNLECLLELRESWFGRENITLVNIGSRWKIANPFSVIAAIGHEIGSATAKPQDVQIYLGVQLRVE